MIGTHPVSRRQFLASALGFTLAVPLVAKAAPPVFIGVDRCEPGVPDRCVVIVSNGETTKTFEVPWRAGEWSSLVGADA